MILPCLVSKIVSAHAYKLLKQIVMGKMMHLLVDSLILTYDISNVYK